LNKIKRIDSFYLVTKIKEHKQIKDKLLELIDQIPQNSYENITHTDWNLPKDYKRLYLDYFYKILKPYMEEMRMFLKEKTWEIQNGWFQQYYKNDFHQWHRHEKTNFANVYYLELPDKNMTTKIKPILNRKKTLNLVAKEGDLVTFPAMLEHTSEKTKKNLRKTIISFNSDFY
jgi:hypothetical protein